MQPRKQFLTSLNKNKVLAQFKRGLKIYKDLHGEYPNRTQFINFSNNSDIISWKIVRKITGRTYKDLVNDLGLKINKKRKKTQDTLEFIHKIASDKNLELESKEYLNSKAKLKFICNKHNTIVYKSLAGLKKSKTACPKCYKEHMAKLFASSVKDVEARVLKIGFKVANKNAFKGIKKPLKFKCIYCGKITKMPPVSLYRKKKCSNC